MRQPQRLKWTQPALSWHSKKTWRSFKKRWVWMLPIMLDKSKHFKIRTTTCRHNSRMPRTRPLSLKSKLKNPWSKRRKYLPISPSLKRPSARKCKIWTATRSRYQRKSKKSRIIRNRLRNNNNLWTTRWQRLRLSARKQDKFDTQCATSLILANMIWTLSPMLALSTSFKRPSEMPLLPPEQLNENFRNLKWKCD